MTANSESVRILNLRAELRNRLVPEIKWEVSITEVSITEMSDWKFSQVMLKGSLGRSSQIFIVSTVDVDKPHTEYNANPIACLRMPKIYLTGLLMSEVYSKNKCSLRDLEAAEEGERERGE
jgi:hypothetical protein